MIETPYTFEEMCKKLEIKNRTLSRFNTLKGVYMLIFPLKNFAHVQRTLFLTNKNKYVYAYAYSEYVYIGTAQEIYSELEGRGLLEIDSEDYYYMGDFKFPRDNNSFLTTLEIKCVN